VDPSANVAVLPVLPLKNTVLFPSLFMPLSVGRPGSLAAIEAVLATEEKALAIVAQRDGADEQPAFDDLYTVGTRAVIKKMARGEGVIEMIVQGVERVTLLKAEQTEPFLKACVTPLPLPEDGGTEVEALHRAIVELAGRVLELAQVQTSWWPRRPIRSASPTCSAPCSASTWPRSRPCSRRRPASRPCA
jgi:ATP-dependent Lon protease